MTETRNHHHFGFLRLLTKQSEAGVFPVIYAHEYIENLVRITVG